MNASLPIRTIEVLVVGGGIAGATLTHYLAREGVETLLVDEGDGAAGGASSVPAALINPNRGRSGRASAADVEGLVGFWSLISELEAEGRDTGALRSGVLRVADNARQARGWRRLEGVHWLETAEVPPAYHAPYGAMLVGRGGWVRPRRLLAALEESAAAHGAVTARGVQALELAAAPHGVNVRTNGGTLQARKVVLCLGAARPAAIRLPEFETLWGAALVLDASLAAPYPLAGSVVAAFGAGEVYVTGGHSPAPQLMGAGAGQELQRALAWQVPGVAGATTLEWWTGARAKRPSSEPVARRLTRDAYIFGALGGRGFLRAATMAEALAGRLREELLG